MNKLNVSVPMNVNGLILWNHSFRAYEYKVFHMLGDHGWYSPVLFERI
jgi:hypothetical protein